MRFQKRFFSLVTLLLSVFLYSTALKRDKNSKDLINKLFQPAKRLIPMEHVEVHYIRTNETEILQKKVLKMFKVALKNKFIHLRDSRYKKVLEKLETLYGFPQNSWNLDENKNFDDQSKFDVFEIINKRVFSAQGSRNEPYNKNTTKSEIELKDLDYTPKEKMETSTSSFFEILDNWRSKQASPSDNLKVKRSNSVTVQRDVSKRNISEEKDVEDGVIEGEKRHTFSDLHKIMGVSQESVNREKISDPLNYCVKDAQKLPIKEYLKQFAISRCSPVLLTPGIFSTKLVVEINCPKFKENSPELFRTCGWTSCSAGFLNNAPNKEYILWLPDILDSLSIISVNQTKNNCWVELFSTPFNTDAVKSKDMQNLFEDTWEKGWRVKLFGDTPGSKKENKCGASAVEYILPYNISADSLGGTKGILDALRKMGYRDGLTLQALPYDFRYASGLNYGFKRSFKQSLIRMKKLTGKKSIIISHSFGSVNTYSSLLDLEADTKSNLVDFWAPVGGPLMGNAKLLGTLATGENPTSFVDGAVGLSKNQALRSFYGTTFSYELLPFDFWKFAKEKWFKDFVLKRMLSENRRLPVEVSRPTFFPNPVQECYKGMLSSQIHCNFLKSVTPSKPLISLKNKGYKLSQMKTFLKDLLYTFPESPKLGMVDVYKLAQGDYREYPHPNVPVVGFFYNFKPTESQYFINSNTLKFGNNNDFSGKLNQTGDETVETYSQIIPMLKWAHDYSYQSSQSSKYPVKFVDICSGLNRNNHPFDSQSYMNRFINNSYIGEFFLGLLIVRNQVHLLQ